MKIAMKQAAKVCIALWIITCLGAFAAQWWVTCPQVGAKGSLTEDAVAFFQEVMNERGETQRPSEDGSDLASSLTAVTVAVCLWAIPIYGDERAKAAVFSI